MNTSKYCWMNTEITSIAEPKPGVEKQHGPSPDAAQTAGVKAAILRYLPTAKAPVFLMIR